MEEILEEHCRFLRGKRVTSDDIREGLVELVRGDKLRRLVLRRVLKAFGRTADDYVKNVLKDLAKANVNLPTYLSTAYEIPYFPGLREDSSMKVPKKWIDEKKVRNVLERFEKNFEVVFSAPTDTKVPVDFVEIVGMIRSVIPTKRLYDIRVFNVPQGNVLVQGSNMLCAIRIYIDKETRTLDLGYASRVEKSKYLEIRVWNSNMSDEECDVMVEILGHVWNYEYALKSCDGETYCQGQQCEAELPLAVAIHHYLKENKQYEDQALEKKIRRMRSVFGDTHKAYVQNVLADLLATKTRIPVIRNCPKVHLDGTYVFLFL